MSRSIQIIKMLEICEKNAFKYFVVSFNFNLKSGLHNCATAQVKAGQWSRVSPAHCLNGNSSF